jgi:hypothetical protein
MLLFEYDSHSVAGAAHAELFSVNKLEKRLVVNKSPGQLIKRFTTLSAKVIFQHKSF